MAASASAGAFRTTSEEFQFMVEIHEASFLTNFLLQFVDGAGGLDGLDASAFRADQIIPVYPGNEQGKVGRPFVQPQSADHSLVAEALKEAKNSRFVANRRKVLVLGQLSKGHGTVVLLKAKKQGFQGLGAPEAGFAGALEEGIEIGHDGRFKGGFVGRWDQVEDPPQS